MTHEPWDEDDDLPLAADDVLLQRYLDGTLEAEEHLQVEFRIDEDPAFARRVASYASLFSALDREAAARAPAPLGLAEAAVAAWDRVQAVNPTPSLGFADLFGGVRPAAAVFVAADVVLGALIVALMASRGPIDVVKDWVLGLKDLALFAASVAPNGEQAAVLLPAVTAACLATLALVWVAGRRIYARTEHLR